MKCIEVINFFWRAQPISLMQKLNDTFDKRSF